jgi:hypothetical protein
MRSPFTSLVRAGVVAAALCVFAAPGTVRAQDAAPAEEAGEKDWADHKGDLPFIVGYEKGMKEVEFSGKPPMYFFTTTW